MKIEFVYQNREFEKEIKYTARLLLSKYKVEVGFCSYNELKDDSISDFSVIISYGKDIPKKNFSFQHLHIYESNFFNNPYLVEENIPELPINNFRGIPILYKSGSEPENWIENKTPSFLSTNIDIIASTFFLVSRFEEVVKDVSDEHGRFPAKESIAFQAGFLERPVVNDYIGLLKKWLKGIDCSLHKKNLWEGQDFGACITHDIDHLRKFDLVPPLRGILSWAIKRKKPGKAIQLGKQYLNSKWKKIDPYDVQHLFTNTIKASKHTLFFMGGGNHKIDSSYDVSKLAETNMIPFLESRNCEIGLHCSYMSFDDKKKLSQEKDNLEEVLEGVVSGSRQHVLRWEMPETLRALERVGLRYDTTMTFAQKAGFRAGISYPFKPFDIEKRRVIDIWELPLTVMDGTLNDYEQLAKKEALKKVKFLIQKVKEANGLFVLLWHNSTLVGPGKWNGWRFVYEEILRYLKSENANFLRCRNVESLARKNFDV